MTWGLLSIATAAVEQAPENSTPWERVAIALVPFGIAVVALFNPKVRAKVQGEDPPKTDPAPGTPAAPSVAQTVVENAGLQHVLVAGLQRQLDDERAERQRTDVELAEAREEIADLRVQVAQLKGELRALRSGWNRT